MTMKKRFVEPHLQEEASLASITLALTSNVRKVGIGA